MFKRATISTAIKGNDYVMGNADFVIQEFHKLRDLILKIGISYYNKNTIIANYGFYRSMCTIFVLITYNLINYDKPTASIFNGFVLKAFNFLWCIFPLAYQSFKVNYKNIHYSKKDFYKAKLGKYSTKKHTTFWILNGIITGSITTAYTFYFYGNLPYYNDLLGLIIIILLNLKFAHYGFNQTLDVCMIAFGIVSFLTYTIWTNNFINLIDFFSSLENIETLFPLLITIIGINFILK